MEVNTVNYFLNFGSVQLMEIGTALLQANDSGDNAGKWVPICSFRPNKFDAAEKLLNLDQTTQVLHRLQEILEEHKQKHLSPLNAMESITLVISSLVPPALIWKVKENKLMQSWGMIASTCACTLNVKWILWMGWTNSWRCLSTNHATPPLNESLLVFEFAWLVRKTDRWWSLVSLSSSFYRHSWNTLTGLILSASDLIDVRKTVNAPAKTFEPDYSFHFTEAITKILKQTLRPPIFFQEPDWLPANDAFAWKRLGSGALNCWSLFMMMDVACSEFLIFPRRPWLYLVSRMCSCRIFLLSCT